MLVLEAEVTVPACGHSATSTGSQMPNDARTLWFVWHGLRRSGVRGSAASPPLPPPPAITENWVRPSPRTPLPGTQRLDNCLPPHPPSYPLIPHTVPLTHRGPQGLKGETGWGRMGLSWRQRETSVLILELVCGGIRLLLLYLLAIALSRLLEGWEVFRGEDCNGKRSIIDYI